MKMGPPINEDRIKAQFEGRKRYQGRECKRCGNSERYVENYMCCECAKNSAQERRTRASIEKHKNAS